MMKKLLSILLAFATALSMCTVAVNAQEPEGTAGKNSVTLLADGDYVVNFPDPVVEEYMLLKFDKNGDGQITKSEITITGSLDVIIDLRDTRAVCADGLEHISAKHIKFRFGQYMKEISLLFTNPSSMEVELRGTAVTDEDFAKIEGSPENSGGIILDISNFGTQWPKIHDLSPIERLNVYDLNIYGCEIERGYSVGDKLICLDARGSKGEGLSELLRSISTMKELEVGSEYINDVKHIDITNRLHVSGNGGIAGNMWSNDLAELKLANLKELTLSSTAVQDLSPLLNSGITKLSISSHLFHRIGNKTIGDLLVKEVAKLHSAGHAFSEINIWECAVVDLSPLEVFENSNTRFNFSYNWIALSYGRNREVIEKVTREGYRLDKMAMCVNQFGFAVGIGENSYQFSDGTKLDFNVKCNKDSFADGEVVTEIVTVTNTGTIPADFDIAFYVEDYAQFSYNNKPAEVNIVSGDMVQSVRNLAPGATVKKTVSFSTNGYRGGTIGASACITCDLDNTILGPESVGIERINLSPRNYMYFHVDGVKTFADKPLIVHGSCSGSTRTVQIQADDGTVLATADLEEKYSSKVFRADIELPETYQPSPGEKSKKFKVKAVAIYDDGKTEESSWVDVEVVQPGFEIEDCFHMVYGASHEYGEKEQTTVYYDDRLVVRAKLAGIDESEVQSVQMVVGGTVNDMYMTRTGKYTGYYSGVSDAIRTGSYVNVILRVTTTSGEVLETPIAGLTVLIDPSGIITDPNGDPIEGVKVTLQKKQEDGTWADWDAKNYMQSNPLYTNAKGYYGWDVPEGTYRIIAEKEGYVKKIVERYYSRDEGKETEITVLPPRMDVDFSMEYADPSNPPKKPMTDGQAKAMVEALLNGGLTLKADADEAYAAETMTSLLSENIYVSFKSGTYQKTDSTETTAGNIKGTLIVENLWTDERAELAATIPLKLASEGEGDIIPDVKPEEPKPPAPFEPAGTVKYTVADGKTTFHIPSKSESTIQRKFDVQVRDVENNEYTGTQTAEVGTEESIVDVIVDYAVQVRDKVRVMITDLK